MSLEQMTELTNWRNGLSQDESEAAGIPDWAKDGNRRPKKKQKKSNGGATRGRSSASSVNKLANKKAKAILKKQKAAEKSDSELIGKFEADFSLANANNAKANASGATARIGATTAACPPEPPAANSKIDTGNLRKFMRSQS